jgi:hypothetical protein
VCARVGGSGNRRTGTAFHFGASYPKDRVRLEGERKIYERDADSGYRIRFHFCPNGGWADDPDTHQSAVDPRRRRCFRRPRLSLTRTRCSGTDKPDPVHLLQSLEASRNGIGRSVPWISSHYPVCPPF